MATKKTPARKAGMPVLIPQPHGGAILSGGTPGQNPGPGRPRAEIKRIALQAFGDRLHILTGIADNTESKERIAALKLLADTGDALQPTALDRELIGELAAAVDQVLSELEGGEAAKQAIYDRWAMTLGRYGAKE